jgi:predicted DNA-binding transcriptional regulator AlpA
MTKIDGLLTEDQAAEALGVVKASLRNWASRRQGPPRIRIGRKIYYRLEAINAWIGSRERDFSANQRKGR